MTGNALTHGHTTGPRGQGKRSPTYNSWRAMIERCTREQHPRYPDYGGRGVTVCERWRGRGGFARFLEDVGERPAGMTLDRIDPNGHYEVGNVRWATVIEQRWNRRDMGERSEPPPAEAVILQTPRTVARLRGEEIQ
jgi:hypothetical protein